MILPPKVIHPTGELEISALIADTFNRRSISAMNVMTYLGMPISVRGGDKLS